MNTPEFYRIGILNMKFDYTTIILWFIYAFWQAFMVLFLSLVIPSEATLSDGKTFGFWAAGHHVYMMAIIFANLIVFRLQNYITGWNEVLMFLQTGTYFFFLYLWEQYYTTCVIYQFGDEFVSSWTAWGGAALAICSLWTLDPIFEIIKNSFIGLIRWCWPGEQGYQKFE